MFSSWPGNDFLRLELIPFFRIVDAVGLCAIGGLCVVLFALGRRVRRSRHALDSCRRVLEDIAEGVVVVDEQRRILSLNGPMGRLFGYEPAELIGRALDTLLPDGVPVVGRECAGRRKDGSTFHLESAICSASAGVKAGSVTLILRDITPRKKVHETLSTRESYLRLVVEQMPAILWTTDTALHITSTLGAGLAAVHLKAREVIGMSMLECLERDRPECTPITAHLKALRGESLSYEMEWKGRAFQVRVDPLRNGEKNITGTIGILVDVTDHKQAVAELKDRHRQQAAVANLGQRALEGARLDGLLNEAVALIGQTLDVEFCAVLEASTDRRTLTPRATAGRRTAANAGLERQAIRTLHSTAPVIALASSPPNRGEEPSSSGISIVIPGERYPFGVLIAQTPRPRKFTPDDSHFIQAVAHILATAISRKQAEEAQARETTERQRLEEQLRQAQKMEAIGRLAGGIAHDFNNLLCIITGYSTLVGDGLAVDEPLREFVAEITKAADRATSLTQQLLAFSRKQMLMPRVLHLNTLLTDLDKMLRRLIGEDIEMVVTLGPDVHPVKADQSQLEQILMNLVVNARDAMPRGGRLAVATSNVELDAAALRDSPEVAPGIFVCVEVSDTGCGMNKEVMGHLFEPFFTTKGQGKGTGLGLATVFGIVKQSNGHIQVSSEPNHGATIRIYLPRFQSVEAVELRPPVSHSPPVDGVETLLLVEDEDGLRALASHTLRQRGYHILEASNGVEALEVSRGYAEPIHLLLSDVVMPKLGGHALAERLITERPDIKLLFMSGFTDSALFRHGIVSGEVECLLKPFTPNVLAQKVREVLDRPVSSLVAD